MSNGEPARDESERSEDEHFSDLLQRGLTRLRDEELEAAIEAFASAASLERQLPEPESTRLEKTLERRVELYEAWGRALAALQRPEQARWQNKRAVDSLLSWAELLLDAGDQNGALHCVEFAFEVGGRDGAFSEETQFSARWMRGRALLATERTDEALEELRLASELAGGTAREQWLGPVHYLIGVAEISLRQYEEAVASFQQAGRLNPALAIFAQNAAFMVLWQRGKYQRAWSKLGDVEQLERAQSTLLDAPARAAELYQLGLARFFRGDFDEAEEHFDESKRLNSRNISLWATLIDFYMDMREHDLEEPNKWYWRARDAFERVKADLEQGAKENPDPSTFLKLGVLSTVVEEHEAAERYFQRVIELGGDASGTQANLGLICLRRGNPRTALARFDAAVRSDPDDLRMRQLLADTYARLQLYDPAEGAYREIIRSAPGNVEAHIGLGELATARADVGDSDLYFEAIREFDRALELDMGMKGLIETRKASTRLSRRQRAAVLYSRGYARAKLFEQRTSWKPLGLFDAGRLLFDAQRDFEAAVEEDPGHFTAKRATDKLGKPIREIPKRVIEGAAPVVAVALSLAILIYVQIAFFREWNLFSAAQYIVLTFGLLMFVFAAFYLPAISKLKVGGAELEKTVTEQVNIPIALGLVRAESADTNVRAFFVDWDHGPGLREPEKKPSAWQAFESWRNQQKRQRVGVVDAQTAVGGD